MFTFDSKHTRSRYKIRAQQQQETFGVVNRRQFGGNYMPMISFHSQAPHVQGHFEVWKQVFTAWYYLCFQETRESVTVSATKDHICKLVQILKKKPSKGV